jgi:peptide/nickel transport system substrate-binding protein
LMAASTALLALALVACGSSSGSGAGNGAAGAGSESTSAGTPVTGGTFSYVTFDESNGFDPILLRAGARAGDSSQASAIFDVLMYPDPQTLEMHMQIAKSLTSTDFKSWDLVIRDGVKFTDGTPYDAEAVKFNWERLADPNNGAPNASGMQPVDTLEVTAPQTLRITLKQASPQFPTLVARYLSYIGSPTAIKKLGDKFGLTPVGAGPFMVQSWVPDSELDLVRNPNYWQTGKPYLDKVVFQQVADDEQRFNTFASGGGDAAIGGPNTIYAKKATDQGFKVQSYTLGGGITMIFNTKKAPFDDVDVRRGIAMALDLDNLNQVINQGTNAAPKTLFAEGTPFYAPDIQLASAQQNATGAQAIFDKYAATTGGPVKFEMTSTTALSQSFELLQGQLLKYKNLEVSFNVIQPTALVPLLKNGEFNVAPYALYSDDVEPSMYDYYHSGAKANFTGISDPQLDAALDAGRATDDQTKRVADYRTAQQRVAELVPEVYIQRYNFNYLLTDKVEGFAVPTTGIQWENIWLAP